MAPRQVDAIEQAEARAYSSRSGSADALPIGGTRATSGSSTWGLGQRQRDGAQLAEVEAERGRCSGNGGGPGPAQRRLPPARTVPALVKRAVRATSPMQGSA